MQEIFLGDMIKRRRMELGLTQEELCEGICEPVTISRLENGKQTPARNRINAILERLDLPADRYYALLSKNETEMEALQKEIIARNLSFVQATGENKSNIRKQIMELHQKLEKLADQDDRIIQQFLLRSTVILGKENDPYTPSEQREILLKAIRLTCPKFNTEEIEKRIYTTEEIKIINQIGISYDNEGRYTEALEIFSHLYEYLQKRYRNTPSVRKSIAMVAFNYATLLDKIKQYDKAIEIAEEGRQMCLNYGHYLSLPGLLEVKAECYFFLEEKEVSKDLYRQAYYLSKALGDESSQKLIRMEAEKYCGITFEI